MKTFIVKFWWSTDLRWSSQVVASDEVRALAKALDSLGLEKWITDKPFQVEICLK